MENMTGWKTKLGAGLMMLSQFLPMLGIGIVGGSQIPLAEIIMGIGQAFAVVGVAHKVEKASK